ncbi:hypothetical protein NECAME_11872 [Necator americanus]|uniref:Uncharacterized protein n=1 Tax=Necator americanus TaxID=51031 RepID=W2T2F3_NECAM|nr:hypothetical protein NECAME_11872 [Necator americanus]ETN76185.1 hypothetical protein NECAME_11872 [Necator americanus]
MIRYVTIAALLKITKYIKILKDFRNQSIVVTPGDDGEKGSPGGGGGSFGGGGGSTGGGGASISPGAVNSSGGIC